jgi:ABC-type glycerol-3-phosphate transport system substrate-binding protein
MVRDLNPLIKAANYDLKQFYPGSIEASTLEGKLFWLNYIGEPCVPFIAFNRTKVEQMGLQPLTDGMTFDELGAWAQKATKDGVFGYYRNNSDNTPHGSAPFLKQHGVEITSADGKKAMFLDNKPGFVKALKFRHDLMNTWKVSPTPSAGAINVNEVFGGQKVLAADVWPNSVQIFTTTFKDFKTDFVLTPLVTKGEKRRSMLNEHAYSVTVASKNPETAFDFLTFIVSKEFQVQAFLKGLKAPNARGDVWGDARLYELYPVYKKLQPIMDSIEADYVVGNFRGDEFDRAYQQGFDQVELGKLQPEAGADEIQKLTQAVLDKPPA